MLQHTENDISTIPFTSRLQFFHADLSTVDWSLIPGCLFIRDYENLPKYSPNDIDLMAPEDSWDALVDLFTSNSNAHELVCICKKSIGGLFVLLFDPFYKEGYRDWSFLEVRKNILLRSGQNITSSHICTVIENGLPVPDESWRFLLLIHQGLRKGKIGKYSSALNEMLKSSNDNSALFREKFSLTDEDVKSIINNPSEEGKWREKIGIKLAGSKKIVPRSKLSVFKQKLARKYYVLHTKGPVFFTLHGPDGVGKTTITNEISSILSGYPFEHEIFHHITGWKRKIKDENVIKKKSSVQNKHSKNTGQSVSLWRQILRIIFRNLPTVLRDIWIYSSNYIKYSTNLNRHILDRSYKNKVMVCDRYIYDLWAKEQVDQDYSSLLYPLHFVFNRLQRFPNIAFMITDDPNEIYKRKQELTPAQIENYQKIMSDILKSMGVQTIEIAVAGRKPEEIAREIVIALLSNIDIKIFGIIKDNKINRNSKNIN